jgi:hypothetical protein
MVPFALTPVFHGSHRPGGNLVGVIAYLGHFVDCGNGRGHIVDFASRGGIHHNRIAAVTTIVGVSDGHSTRSAFGRFATEDVDLTKTVSVGIHLTVVLQHWFFAREQRYIICWVGDIDAGVGRALGSRASRIKA